MTTADDSNPTGPMTSYDKRLQVLAAGLSALAGYVDAIGFLSLHGFFVSFMSGNSTQMSVGFARGSDDALIAATLIGLFVFGVVCGSTVGRIAGAARRHSVLAFVTVLLGIAGAFGSFGEVHGAVWAMTIAMGAENAVFERDGEVQVGVTYMTGTLVKLGQRVTGVFFGDDPLAWLPYLLLWLGLVVGAIVGAAVFPWLSLSGLWIAAGGSAILAYAAFKIDLRTK